MPENPRKSPRNKPEQAPPPATLRDLPLRLKKDVIDQAQQINPDAIAPIADLDTRLQADVIETAVRREQAPEAPQDPEPEQPRRPDPVEQMRAAAAAATQKARERARQGNPDRMKPILQQQADQNRQQAEQQAAQQQAAEEEAAKNPPPSAVDNLQEQYKKGTPQTPGAAGPIQQAIQSAGQDRSRPDEELPAMMKAGDRSPDSLIDEAAQRPRPDFSNLNQPLPDETREQIGSMLERNRGQIRKAWDRAKEEGPSRLPDPLANAVSDTERRAQAKDRQFAQGLGENLTEEQRAALARGETLPPETPPEAPAGGEGDQARLTQDLIDRGLLDPDAPAPDAGPYQRTPYDIPLPPDRRQALYDHFARSAFDVMREEAGAVSPEDADQSLAWLREHDYPRYMGLVLRMQSQALEAANREAGEDGARATMADVPNPLIEDMITMETARRMRLDTKGKSPVEVAREINAEQDRRAAGRVAADKAAFKALSPTEQAAYYAGNALVGAGNIIEGAVVGTARAGNLLADTLHQTLNDAGYKTYRDSYMKVHGEEPPLTFDQYMDIQRAGDTDAADYAGHELMFGGLRAFKQTLADTPANRLAQSEEVAFYENGTALAQGFGSMLGFGGVLSAGAKQGTSRLSQYLGAAALGSPVSGDGFYRAAIAEGATRDQAETAMLMGMAVGTSEGIPIERMMGRARVTGRLFEHAKGRGGRLAVVGKQLARDVRDGTAEESIQEAFQTFGENLSAKTLYDQDRELFEGVLEAAGTGGMLGGIFSGMASANGISMAAVQEYQQAKADGDTQRARELLAEMAGVTDTRASARATEAEQARQLDEFEGLSDAERRSIEDGRRTIDADQTPLTDTGLPAQAPASQRRAEAREQAQRAEAGRDATLNQTQAQETGDAETSQAPTPPAADEAPAGAPQGQEPPSGLPVSGADLREAGVAAQADGGADARPEQEGDVQRTDPAVAPDQGDGPAADAAVDRGRAGQGDGGAGEGQAAEPETAAAEDAPDVSLQQQARAATTEKLQAHAGRLEARKKKVGARKFNRTIDGKRLKAVQAELGERRRREASRMTDDQWVEQSRFYTSGGTKRAELPSGERVILAKENTAGNFREKSRDFLLDAKRRLEQRSGEQAQASPTDEEAAAAAEPETAAPGETSPADGGTMTGGATPAPAPAPGSDAPGSDAAETAAQTPAQETPDDPRTRRTDPGPGPDADVQGPAAADRRAREAGETGQTDDEGAAEGPRPRGRVDRGPDGEADTERAPAGDAGGRDDGDGGGGETDRGDRAADADADRTEPAGYQPELIDRPAKGSDARNHTIERDETVAPASNKGRFSANMEALRTLAAIRTADRLATAEEKRKLARYTGFGWANFESAEGQAMMAELEALLSKREIEAVKRSTLNAHYTRPDVIAAMWDMVEQLGFKGGKVLEPSTGIGHFIGVMPERLADRSRTAQIEQDPISGEIARLLYPESDVQIDGFQHVPIDNATVDLAISNVPFGGFKASGAKDYPNHLIHDYFFARALDKVKPGGLVAFITSNGTMDKADSKMRRELQGRADLVASVRLPANTFGRNAGTDVTTDIIILRKHTPKPWEGRKDVPDWTEAVEVGTDSDNGEPIVVNNYYAARPEHALGTHTRQGSRYGAGMYALQAGESGKLSEVDAELARLPAIARTLPEGVMDPQTPEVGADTGREAPKGAVELGHVEQDGQWYQVVDGKLTPAPWLTQKNYGEGWEKAIDDAELAKRKKRAPMFFKLAEARDAVIQSELAGEPKKRQDARRKKLNQVYARVIKATKTGTYASLNRPSHAQGSAPFAFLQDDPAYYKVLALERENESIDPETGKSTYTYEKQAIFTKPTVARVQRPTSAASATDAIGISLNFDGRLDLNTVADLLGTAPEQAADQLRESGQAFLDPASGQWMTRAQYTSGPVVRRLREAKAAVAEGQAEFQANVDALEPVQPERVSLSEVQVNLASRWVPPEVLSAWASETLGGDIRIKYIQEANTYTIEGEASEAAQTEYGTDRADVMKLLDKALKNQQHKVYDNYTEGGKKVSVINKAATEDAARATRKLEQQFARWIKTNQAQVTVDGETIPAIQRTEDVYNEVNNAVVETAYSGEHMTFPGLSNDVWLKDYRTRAVARVMQDGGAVLAHGVGSGKTLTMIMAAHELKRTGLRNKPMIVVKKPTVTDFASAVQMAYPTANALVASDKSFSKGHRKRFMNQIAVGDWDVVIITQEQITKLRAGEHIVKRYFQKQLDQLEEAIRAAKAVEGKSPTTKQLEKAKQAMEDKQARMLSDLAGRQDEGLTFEELGIDQLFIDEAHDFKKIPINSRMQNIKGLPNDTSQRAMHLDMVAEHLRRIDGGVVTATGTPITNTVAEAYVMLKLSRPDVLETYGIRNFDDFANTFGEAVEAMEFTYAMKFKFVTRFNKLVNLPELVRMIRQGFDVAIGNEKLGLDVPRIKGGAPTVTEYEPTESLEQANQKVIDAVSRFEDLDGQERRDNGWVPIVAMGYGTAAALDPRLVDPSAKDEKGSKVNRALEEVVRIHKASAGSKGTQMIFADRYRTMDTEKLDAFIGGRDAEVEVDETLDQLEAGEERQAVDEEAEQDKHAVGDFNLYHDIRDKLVKAGVPRSEIAIIGDADTDNKREKLFAAINAGRVRIVMGSTEKLGVGVNAQKKLIALHALDPPRDMTPAKVEQRLGRIIRQGHEKGHPSAKEVEVFYYGVVKSMDAGVWQKIEQKGRFIDAMLSGNVGSRTMEDLSTDATAGFAEFQAKLSGDPRALRVMELSHRLDQLKNDRAGHEAEITRAIKQKNEVRAEIEAARASRKKLQDARPGVAERFSGLNDYRAALEAKIAAMAAEHAGERKDTHERLRAVLDSYGLPGGVFKEKTQDADGKAVNAYVWRREGKKAKVVGTNLDQAEAELHVVAADQPLPELDQAPPFELAIEGVTYKRLDQAAEAVDQTLQKSVLPEQDNRVTIRLADGYKLMVDLAAGKRVSATAVLANPDGIAVSATANKMTSGEQVLTTVVLDAARRLDNMIEARDERIGELESMIAGIGRKLDTPWDQAEAYDKAVKELDDLRREMAEGDDKKKADRDADAKDAPPAGPGETTADDDPGQVPALSAGRLPGTGAGAGADRSPRLLPVSSLVFTEEEQTSLDQVREWLVADTDPLDIAPLVAVRERNGDYSIVDGHNQATVASEVGIEQIPALTIDRATYDSLLETFDAQEIAAGMAQFAGDFEQVSRLNEQFGGAGIYKSADAVASRLTTLPTNPDIRAASPTPEKAGARLVSPDRLPDQEADRPAKTKAGRKLVDNLHKDTDGQKYGIRSINDFLIDAVKADMREGLAQVTGKMPAFYMEGDYHIIRAVTNSFQLTFHEVGHALDALTREDLAPVMQDLGPALVALAKAPGSSASAHTTAEGFAEYIRRVVSDPVSVPVELRKRIGAFLKENYPDIQDALDDARLAMEAHLNRTNEAKRRSYKRDQPRLTLAKAKQRRTMARHKMLYNLSAGAALDTRVYARMFDALEAHDARFAKETMAGLKNTAGDFQAAYAMTLHTPGEVNRAMEGSEKGMSGIRVKQTGDANPFIAVLKDIPTEARQRFNELFAFDQTPGGAGHGNSMYLTDYAIRDVIEAVGEENWDSFEDYGQARAALARFDLKGHQYMGLSEDQDAETLRRDIEQYERENPDWPAQFERIRHHMNQLLLVPVLAGEIDAMQAIQIAEAYGDDYWPLPRAIEGKFAKRKLAGDAPTAGIERAYGSPVPFADILEAVEARTSQALEAYYQNRMGMAIFNATKRVTANTDLPLPTRAMIRQIMVPLRLDMKKVATLDVTEQQKIVADYKNQQTAEDLNTTVDQLPDDVFMKPSDVQITGPGFDVYRPKKPAGVRVIALTHNGERAYFEIRDPVLYEFFARNEEGSKGIIKFANWLAQAIPAWKRGHTHSYRFILWSQARDFGTALMFGKSWVPFRYLAGGLMQRTAAMLGNENAARLQAADTTEQLSRAYNATMGPKQKGLVNNFVALLQEDLTIDGWKSMNALERTYALRRDSLRLSMAALAKPRDVMHYVTGSRALSQTMEGVPREAAFVQALNAGESEERAQMAFDAVSGRFIERPGAPTAQAVFRAGGFMNAGVQILYQTYNTFATRPYETGAKLGLLFMTGAVTAAISALFWDEEDKRQLRQRTDEDRLRYMNIATPFGGPRLRMPFDYGPSGAFTSLGYNMVEGYLLREPVDMTSKEAAWLFLDRVTSLPGVTDMFGPYLNSLLEVKANYSFFFDRELVSPWLQTRLPQDQAYDSTPMMYKWIGKKLGVSPLKVEHVVYQTQTSSSAEMVEVVHELFGYGTREDPYLSRDNLPNLPGVGGLFARDSEGWRAKSVKEIDDFNAIYQSAKSSRDRLIEQIDPDAYEALKTAESSIERRAKLMRTREEELATLRRRIDREAEGWRSILGEARDRERRLEAMRERQAERLDERAELRDKLREMDPDRYQRVEKLTRDMERLDDMHDAMGVLSKQWRAVKDARRDVDHARRKGDDQALKEARERRDRLEREMTNTARQRLQQYLHGLERDKAASE